MANQRARRIALVNTAKSLLSAAGAGAVVAAGTANPALTAILVASGAKLIEMVPTDFFNSLPAGDAARSSDLRASLWELADLALTESLKEAEAEFSDYQRKPLRRLARGAPGFHAALLTHGPTGSGGPDGELEQAVQQALTSTNPASTIPEGEWEALVEELASRAEVPITYDLKIPLASFLARRMQPKMHTLLIDDGSQEAPLGGRAWATVEWIKNFLHVNVDRPAILNTAEKVRQLPETLQPQGSWLYNPRLPDNSRSEADRLSYRRALDEFLGRREDVEAVYEHLQLDHPQDSQFRWSILSGSAGTGKSRLAMELQDRSVAWPRRGFAAPGVVRRENALAWRLEEPTLIVIDYAGHKEGVAEFVQAFAQRAKTDQLNQAVRILLVERRSDDPNLEQISTGELREIALQYQRPSHELDTLDRGDVLRIMKDRIAESEQARNENWPDEILLAILDHHDPRRRPLYAALVGDAIANRYLFRDGSEHGTMTRGHLFEALLDRERKEVWHLSGREQASYENLLLLATFTGGLHLEHFDEISEQPSRGLPLPESLDFEIYARVAMTSAAQIDERLPPLEPDLLGERLVLRSLLQETVRSANAPRRNRWLRRLAWQYGRESTASFVQKCFDNYPEDVFRLGWLLPEGEPLELELLAPFIATILWSINAACGDSPPTVGAENMVLDLLDRLDERLGSPDDPTRFGLLSPRVARWIALAYSYAARSLGAQLNRTLLDAELPALLGDFPAPPKPLTKAFSSPATPDSVVVAEGGDQP
jgi:hypothetical protein